MGNKFIKIEYKGGEIKHDFELTAQLRRSEREKVRLELFSTNASELQKDLMLSTDVDLKNKGNLGDYKGLQVLDQVRKETLALQDTSKDDILDLFNFMGTDSNLHYLMMNPFTIFSISQKQMDVLQKLKKSAQKMIACIDATGKVVRRPRGVSNDILYYAGVINVNLFDERNGINFPFMEMITEKQNYFNIKIFLEFFKIEFQKYAGAANWPIFTDVVTDFSRALLNAISVGWNMMTTIAYINLTYEWMNDRLTSKKNELVKIHLCYSFMLFSHTEKFQ